MLVVVAAVLVNNGFSGRCTKRLVGSVELILTKSVAVVFWKMLARDSGCRNGFFMQTWILALLVPVICVP